jgi:tetratricopeptide (TPR) repeat protein
LQKALDLRRQLLGEKHRDTVTSYNDVGINLNDLGRYAEAQPLLQKALDLHREILGERHPTTAGSYSNVAYNLNDQGKYAEAQPLFQKALDLHLELLGEKHPSTANSYNNLAFILDVQGRRADAQPLYQKALDLRRDLFGEKHPKTAESFNNLGLNLIAQGKYATALPLLQKALDVNRQWFGDKHPHTARAYINLAGNLQEQRKYAEAHPLFQKALDLNRELLGEKHPHTAYSYSSLAGNMSAQRQYAEAQPLYQTALDLRRELLGEKHPDTAQSYNNLAGNLYARGIYSDAQPLFQKALDLRRELFGEQHPETAQGYMNLARNRYAQREYADTQMILKRAVHSYEASRLAGAQGLDRAALKMSDPRLLLVPLLANSDPQAAWSAAEMTLARGLLDEQSARKATSLTPAELADQVQWQSELAGAQSEILVLVANSQRTESENRQLEELIDKRNTIEQRLAELAVRLSQREVASSDAIQASLLSDAAFLFWVDDWEHWGCVVRSVGKPNWERLPGTGPEEHWTQSDADLPNNVRASLGGNATSSEIATLLKQLYAQRLAPLVKHLEGVKRLYVVPVAAMAGVPIEAITSDYTISYVPSGTFLAKLKDRGKLSGRPCSPLLIRSSRGPGRHRRRRKPFRRAGCS